MSKFCFIFGIKKIKFLIHYYPPDKSGGNSDKSGGNSDKSGGNSKHILKIYFHFSHKFSTNQIYLMAKIIKPTKIKPAPTIIFQLKTSFKIKKESNKVIKILPLSIKAT